MRMKILFPSILVLLLATLVNAQSVPGLPAWGTFAGGNVDSVDVASLQPSVAIPLLEKKGVGLNLSATWRLWPSVWQHPGGLTFWAAETPVTGVLSALGKVTSAPTEESCYSSAGYLVYYDVYSDYTYTDASGVDHALAADAAGDPLITEDPYPSGCGPSGPYPTTATGIAMDGSGYTASVTGGAYSANWIKTPSGTTITPGSDTIVDRNQNTITSHTTSQGYWPNTIITTTLTDTLGITEFTSVVNGAQLDATYSYPSPSGTGVYTETDQNMTLQSAFGCPNLSESNATTWAAPVKLQLPDGSEYQFTYETTPGYGYGSGYTTGRLASVTLPTGATITYSYPGANDDVDCSTGDTVEIDRTTPDGTTTYVRSGNTTTVTDPTGNQTVYTFDSSSPSFLTEKQVYEGSASTGSLLETEQYCYNGAVPSCPGNPGSTGVTEIDDEVTTGPEHRHTLTTMDWAAGAPSAVQESDWGTSGEGGSWLRQSLTTYDNSSFPGLPAEIKVEDGSGATASDTTYTRDSSGNATSVAYAVSAGSSLTRHFTFNPNGTVATATDVNGAVTDYTYGDCNGAFPTKIESVDTGLTKTMTWDCNGGVMTSQTGVNGHTSQTTAWDPNFWRPTQTENAAGDYTNITYTTASGAWSVESSTTFNGGASTSDTLTTFDGLGRPVLVQKRQAPASSSFDTVETEYNADGQAYRVSMPYTAAAGVKNASAWTTTTFDALGRPTFVDDAGQGVTSYQYSDNTVEVSRGGASSQTFSRNLQYDGLGRLSSVCEMTQTLAGFGACDQSLVFDGYWTQYTYNPLGEITGVLQNAQGTPQQSRSFQYDELGRMTSETTPESGTSTFTYDSACGTTYDGDMVSSQNANGDVLCYQYDKLHRLTEVSKSSGPDAFTTEYRVYDSASIAGFTVADAKGRLAEAYTGSSTDKITDDAFSYDPLGDVTGAYQDSPNSGTPYISTETYYGDGAPEALSLPGMPTITYNTDGEGRPTTVSASAGQNPVTAVTYNDSSGAVPDSPTSVTMGPGDSDTYTFDDATGRMQTYQFNTGEGLDIGTLTWNTNGTLEQLAINDGITGTVDTQTCSFSYDDLARLTGTSCTGTQPFSQSFTYDPFGNITASGSEAFGATYTAANRIDTNINITANYDNDGNLLNDPVQSATNVNAFDAAGRAVKLENVVVTYDALGRAVEAGGQEFLYAPDGRKMAVMTGQTADKDYIPLPGGGAAVYSAGSLDYYMHADWQGSARLETGTDGSLHAAAAYSPYGYIYDSVGPLDASFTGQRQDIDSATSGGQYSFPNRAQNPTQMRWWTPDPAGLAAVDPANPQSWDRYAYVNGDPLTNVDPSGLDTSCSLNSSGTFGCVTNVNGTVTADTGSTVVTTTVYSYTYCAFFGCSGGPPELTLYGYCMLYGCVGTGNYTGGDPGAMGGGGASGPANGANGVPVASATSCAQPNLIQRAGIAVLGWVARITGRTIGLGASGSAGIGVVVGASANVSRQIVVSPGGMAAFETTYGYNAFPFGVTAGSGALGGISFSLSGAQSPQQLSGPSYDFSGSYGEGVGVQGEYSVGSTWQDTVTIGVGYGGKGGVATPQESSIDPICSY